MLLHSFPLLGVELAGLVQNRITDAQFAYVVQQCAALEPTPMLWIQAHGLSNQVGIERYPRTVAGGVGALSVHHLAECGGYVVQVVFVQRHLIVSWLQL